MPAAFSGPAPSMAQSYPPPCAGFCAYSTYPSHATRLMHRRRLRVGFSSIKTIGIPLSPSLHSVAGSRTRQPAEFLAHPWAACARRCACAQASRLRRPCGLSSLARFASLTLMGGLRPPFSSMLAHGDSGPARRGKSPVLQRPARAAVHYQGVALAIAALLPQPLLLAPALRCLRFASILRACAVARCSSSCAMMAAAVSYPVHSVPRFLISSRSRRMYFSPTPHTSPHSHSQQRLCTPWHASSAITLRSVRAQKPCLSWRR